MRLCSEMLVIAVFGVCVAFTWSRVHLIHALSVIFAYLSGSNIVVVTSRA